MGPGYGECTVIHRGDGEWVVVDSCYRTNTGNLALGYLERLGVDVAASVRTIVATHWHDDHVRGIASLFEQAVRAEFIMSASIRPSELEAATGNAAASRFTSGVSELQRVTEIARNADGGTRVLRPVVAGTRIFSSQALPVSEIWVLSPSPADVQIGWEHISAELASLRNSVGLRRAASLDPNDTSVVIGIETKFGPLLLGADLEHQSSVRDRGWHAVMDLHSVPNMPARLFKIPHHGSINADCPEVWEHRVQDEAVAVLAPFNRGRVSLPTQVDTKRIRARAANAYRTTGTIQALKKRDQTTTKTIREATKTFMPNTFIPGHIQVRVTKQGLVVRGSPEARPL